MPKYEVRDVDINRRGKIIGVYARNRVTGVIEYLSATDIRRQKVTFTNMSIDKFGRLRMKY
jgi:hypothetical protein